MTQEKEFGFFLIFIGLFMLCGLLSVWLAFGFLLTTFIGFEFIKIMELRLIREAIKR